MLWIAFAIFLGYAVSLLYPLVWVLLNSFKDSGQFFADPFGLAKHIYLENYVDAFKLEVSRTNLVGMFGNSLILVAGCTFVSVFVPTLSAYVISKYKFKGRNFLYSLAISTMLIPAIGTLSATYKLMVDTGLYNTYIGIIIMSSGGFGFNFIMIYGFFRNISWAYAEAAMLDGAGDFKIFLSIMLPQVWPLAGGDRHYLPDQLLERLFYSLYVFETASDGGGRTSIHRQKDVRAIGLAAAFCRDADFHRSHPRHFQRFPKNDYGKYGRRRA